MLLFKDRLNDAEFLIFDGATGTELQSRGLPAGQSPEIFCLENPSVMESVHLDYCKAGADVITTNTFGGTRFKLPEGLNVFDFNKKMAEIAKYSAAKSGRQVFVAGSIGPTGKFLRPLGELDFGDMVLAFEEQIKGLVAGGVDLILAETQFDIAEARAIVVAHRRVSCLPIGVSMTYEDGITLTGSSVSVCTNTLANMGVDFIAMNCSAGPAEMRNAALELLSICPVPVVIQPNAGLPELRGETTVFPMQAESFATLTSEFARYGAKGLGGCCGTTPKHIETLKGSLQGRSYTPSTKKSRTVVLTSRTDNVYIGENAPFCVIGERINPTGKKQLTAELQGGIFTLAMQYADEQIAAGAHILDVNVGAPMVDEAALLPSLTQRLAAQHSLPLSIDSSNPDAVLKSLEVYPACPLVNSISGEAGRMEKLGVLCRDFGAPFVLLPLKGKNLPVLAKERIAIIEELLQKMQELKIPRDLAVVDILALAVSSSAEAAKEALKFIKYCTDVLHLPTVCGLSNISFGLPARDLLNATFLSLAVGAGLSGAIANPMNPRVAEALKSIKLLQGHDDGAENFIANFSTWKHGEASATQGLPSLTSKPISAEDTIEQAVILGKKDIIVELVKKSMAEGQEPFTLVGERLIPAITIVGEKYERKEYFLPQLIRSAETMQAAFTFLRPLLAKDNRTEVRPVVIMATVEGDIHDIGKNIVSLLMGNHGFEVIDIGKDVPARTIVEKAKEHKASFIGLSALMTTTMVRMQDTVELVKKENLPIKVLVGGAVVTEAFARSIGAHYSKDAVGAVRLLQELIKQDSDFNIS